MKTRDLLAPVSPGTARAMVFLFLLSLLTALASATLAAEHVSRDERRWCQVLRDPASAAQARDFAALYRQFGCPVP